MVSLLKRKLRAGEKQSLSKAYIAGFKFRTSISIVLLLKIKSLDLLPDQSPQILESGGMSVLFSLG